MPRLHAPASWLFVKGEETVWILRPEDFVLLIYGPGPTQKRHTFDGEASMEGFHVWLAEELMSSGWILWGIDRDRRSGHDRRGTRRDVPDRRLAAREGTTLAADSGPQR
ncbi:MAG TPA: hypothetical protein VIX63_15775 [Vicinamibacterales bacterium]